MNLQRTLAVFILVSFSLQASAFSDQIGGWQNQNNQPGVSSQQNQSNSGQSNQNQNTTSNNFLSGNNSLSHSNVSDAVEDTLEQVIKGSVTKIKNKDGKLIVTFKPNENYNETKNFFNKAAGPLKDSAEARSITFTMSSDASTIEKAEFAGDDGKNYKLTFSEDSTEIVTSVVLDPDNPVGINCYTINYTNTGATIYYADFQNDGSVQIDVTQSGSVTTLVHYYDLEQPPFRTTTITKTSSGLTVHSELQFGEDPPFTEYDAVTYGDNSIKLNFETSSYGPYSVTLGDFDDLHDLIQNNISKELSRVEVAQFFLTALEFQMGISLYDADDLKKNYITVFESEPASAISSITINRKTYSVFLEVNTDPDTFENQPLIITPNPNRNSDVDTVDLLAAKTLKTNALLFLKKEPIFDTADFLENSIILSSESVWYNGEVHTFRRTGSYIIHYSESLGRKIVRITGKKRYYHFWWHW